MKTGFNAQNFPDVRVGGLSIDQLAIVHVTRFEPEISDGVLNIDTTFDAVGGLDQDPEAFKFRNTIHTSLNGPVSSHMQGNWDDMSCVVVAPLLNAVERNGAPAGFCTVDTFWALSEDTPLTLSEFKVVRPAEGQLGADEFVRNTESTNVFYKAALDDQSRRAFMQDFWVGLEGRGRNDAYNNLAWHLQNRSHEAAKAIPNALLSIEGDDDAKMLEDIVLDASGELREQFDVFMVSTIRDEAVHNALRDFDCPVKTCGKNYWVNEGTSDGSAEFAEALGTEYASHYYSKQGELERFINGRSMFSVHELPSPDEVQDFINENQDELPNSTMDLVETLIDSSLYEDARRERTRLLNPHPMMGHNGGPEMEFAHS